MNRRNQSCLLSLDNWIKFPLGRIILIYCLFLLSTGCVRQTDTASTTFVEPIHSLNSQIIKFGDISFDEVLQQIPRNDSITFFTHTYRTSLIYKVGIKDTNITILKMNGLDVPKGLLNFQSDTLVPFFSVIDSNLFLTVDVNTNRLNLVSDSIAISQYSLPVWQNFILLSNRDIEVLGNQIFIPYEDNRYSNIKTPEEISNMYQNIKPLLHFDKNRLNEIKPFGAYPEEYIQKGAFGYNMSPSVAPSDEGYLLSFPGAENLVLVSRSGKKIKEVNASSLEQIPYQPINSNDYMVISKVMKWFAQTPLYGQFHYNFFRDEYYRIYQIPDKQGELVSYNLIRLNKNLVKIQEFRIPAKLYNFQVFVSTPRGFAIKLRSDSTNIENTRNSLREFYLN